MLKRRSEKVICTENKLNNQSTFHRARGFAAAIVNLTFQPARVQKRVLIGFFEDAA